MVNCFSLFFCLTVQSVKLGIKGIAAAVVGSSFLSQDEDSPPCSTKGKLDNIKSEPDDGIKMDMKGQRSDCSVEMNHRSESGGKGMNATDQIKTEIKTEPMDEGSTTSENSATVKGEFLGKNM